MPSGDVPLIARLMVADTKESSTVDLSLPAPAGYGKKGQMCFPSWGKR